MPASNFRISYEVCELGLLGTSSAQELSLLDITNYSLEGTLTITLDGDTLSLLKVPLLETFHAIRQVLKVLPIFIKKVPYAQMFREARTFFSVEDDLLIIEHKEIPALREGSGSRQIKGSYVAFCVEYGTAAKRFVRELEVLAPSLFHDEKTASKFVDLFVSLTIKDDDPRIHSIV